MGFWVVLGTEVKYIESTLGGSLFLWVPFLPLYLPYPASQAYDTLGQPHASPLPQHVSLLQNPSPTTSKLPSFFFFPQTRFIKLNKILYTRWLKAAASKHDPFLTKSTECQKATYSKINRKVPNAYYKNGLIVLWDNSHKVWLSHVTGCRRTDMQENWYERSRGHLVHCRCDAIVFLDYNVPIIWF